MAFSFWKEVKSPWSPDKSWITNQAAEQSILYLRPYVSYLENPKT